MSCSTNADSVVLCR